MTHFITRIHETIRSAKKVHGASPSRAAESLCKEYARMERIMLPPPQKVSAPLDETIRRRASFNETATGDGFSPQEIGTLLGLALGVRSGSLRNYPSGGGLFPIETYLLGNVVQGRNPGAFHYHPIAHALENMWDIPQEELRETLYRAESPHSDTLLVFTAIWERSSKKYGTLAYSHSLIEAGHMAQNLLLVAAAQGIKTRPLSGFDDAAISSFLDIDDEEEQPVYSISLRK